MSESRLDLDLDELSSAEEFLEYFGIAYEPSVVHVNRLHILQRFHDHIDGVEPMPESDEQRHKIYADLLNRAYNDFVTSDALTEKVFKVFRLHEPASVEVPFLDPPRQVQSGAPEV